MDQGQLVYNLKTTFGDYERVGKKNPRWDVEAKECLAEFARIRSSTNGTPNDLVQELRTHVARIAASGCDDPLIRYLQLRYSDKRTGADLALAFSRVASALQRSDYADIRKFYATMWARKTLVPATPRRPEAAEMLTTAASYLALALDDAAMPTRRLTRLVIF